MCCYQISILQQAAATALSYNPKKQHAVLEHASVQSRQQLEHNKTSSHCWKNTDKLTHQSYFHQLIFLCHKLQISVYFLLLFVFESFVLVTMVVSSHGYTYIITNSASIVLYNCAEESVVLVRSSQSSTITQTFNPSHVIHLPLMRTWTAHFLHISCHGTCLLESCCRRGVLQILTLITAFISVWSSTPPVPVASCSYWRHLQAQTVFARMTELIFSGDVAQVALIYCITEQECFNLLC